MRFFRKPKTAHSEESASVVDAFVDALFQQMPKLLRRRRRDRRGFEHRLYKRWHEGLDLFDMLCHMSLEVGSTCNTQERPAAAAANDAKFEVLVRLHARACSVASEVLALMSAGHASGAYSRWRSLHELAVVASVISKGDHTLAERYLLHEIIESHKAAQEYFTFQERLELEKVAPSEVEELKIRREQLEQKYGRSFRGQYGWATDYIGHEPTFADLETAADLGHWRPYYRLASHGVHANPKGALWNMGYGRMTDLLVAGASNAGLADPGHQALLSLHIVTASLLAYKPDVERLLMLKAMDRMVKLAGEAFLRAHKNLEQEIQASKQEVADSHA